MKKFGIFNHFLPGAPGGTASADAALAAATDAARWNRMVEAFDTARLARQVYESGASYYGITLMQGRPFLCAPNEAFDEIAGTKPGEACAERDLILDLSRGLARYGLALMLYFTGDGPYLDETIGRRFGFVEPRNGNATLAFSEKWARVMEEYAVRYGKSVSYWWIDGCYDFFAYDDEKLEPYRRAAKRGNPAAMVTMNNGVKPSLYRYFSREDYTSGEQNDFTVLPEGDLGGVVPHVLAPLGLPSLPGKPWSCWRQPGCKRDGAYMHEYVRRMNEAGGFVSVDILVRADGSLDDEQLEVLSRI